jgi:FdhD protein
VRAARPRLRWLVASGSARVRVRVVEHGPDQPADQPVVRSREDVVAVEEPLEVRVESPAGQFPLAVTMRTPGADLELAAGFLHSEGVVRSAADIITLRHCIQVPREQRDNTVTVRLAAAPTVAAAAMARRFTVSSACGVCGVESLAALADRGVSPVQPTPVRADLLLALPDRLRAAQAVFERTGGLHASGLFAPDGTLLCAREDVGRHNAFDKVVGWALMQGRLPLAGHTVLVSGRTSYELVQKAVTAGVGVLAGVSAPSSLAVQLADRFGLALVGFLRERRFVVYTGELAP